MGILSQARKRYMAKPTKAALRTYLNVKAKAGVFDRRMCADYGVPVPMNASVRKAICRAWVAGLVPTATSNGTHAPGSYHKTGQAVDFGLRPPEVGTLAGLNKLITFQRKEFWRARVGKIKPVELIGPTNNLVILRGGRSPLVEGTTLEQMHDTHVHEAYPA